MKKLIITLALAAIATITVLAVSYRKDNLSQYIPEEQPISAGNQTKLMPLQKALVDMCNRGEWGKLGKCFNISEADRLLAKQESGEDPVEKYLGLLKDYTPLMRDAKWEMTELVKNSNLIFFRLPAENGKKLCISLMKRKGKYLFNSVEEIQRKNK